MKKVLMTYMESGMGHITSIKSISDNFKQVSNPAEYEVQDCYIMQEDNDKVLKKFEKFIINQTKSTNKIKGYGNFVFFLMKILGGVKFMRLLHRTFFRRAVSHMLEALKRESLMLLSAHIISLHLRHWNIKRKLIKMLKL